VISYKDLYNTQESIKKWIDKLSIEVNDSYPIDNIENLIPDFKRNVAVDLGANIGLFSIKVAKSFKHVHAFEPVPFLSSIASHKISALGLENVIINRLAASDKTGQITKIYKSKSGHPGDNSLLETNDMNLLEYDNCLTISLEDIFKLIDYDYIDYMKMDIEGSEYSFMNGKDLSNIGIIAMEIHNHPSDSNAIKNLQKHIGQYMHVWRYPLSESSMVCVNKSYKLVSENTIKHFDPSTGIHSDLEKIY
jgi:FkbM family methyltransferase